MTDQMPMFDDPITPLAEQPPKKPRKPIKRRKMSPKKAVSKPAPKRRGRPPGKAKKFSKVQITKSDARLKINGAIGLSSNEDILKAYKGAKALLSTLDKGALEAVFNHLQDDLG